jgi:hypothetical protein
MKTQPFKLTIQNPCSQDWNTMTKNEQGKFCDLCAKSVIDFTHLSDQEISKIIASHSGSTCGRLKVNQLNRELANEKHQRVCSPRKFLAGLFILGATKPVFGTNDFTPTSTIQFSVKQGVETGECVVNSSEDTLIQVIEGTVIDDTYFSPIPSVIVEIRGTSLKAITDFDGKFKIVLPDTFEVKVITLYSNYLDGKVEELVVDRSKAASPIELKISMGTELDVIGMYIVLKPKRWWQFWK